MAKHVEDDYQWPEPSEMEAADALLLMDKMERAATQANRAAEVAKQRKSISKTIANQVLELKRLPSASVMTPDGKRINYTPYKFDVFYVKNQAEFDAWEAEQHEHFYTPPERSLREQVFQDYMRKLWEEKQPIPPGVGHYEEDRISRTSVPVRKRKR